MLRPAAVVLQGYATGNNDAARWRRVVLQGGATGGAAIGRRQCYFQVQATARAFPLMPSALVLQIVVEASLRTPRPRGWPHGWPRRNSVTIKGL
jgi:hypothetical protein